MTKFKLFISAIFSFLIFCIDLQSKQSLPADITSFVVDLKYNEKQGVKICEIQPISEATLRGYGYATQTQGVLEEKLCQTIYQYQSQGPFWFFDLAIYGENLKKKLGDHQWQRILNQRLTVEEIFQGVSKDALEDPSDLTTYEGVVYVRPLKKQILDAYSATYKNIFSTSAKEFYSLYPRLLLLDAAIFPYLDDKYLIAQLLNTHYYSAMLRPKWNHYPKKYSLQLAKTIQKNIGGDIFVLKPRALTKGRGIFIVHADDLDETLRTLFLSDRATLNSPFNSSYREWLRDEKETFLVEEFIPSDPITVPHLNNKIYDATMRVAVVCTYHQKQVNVNFLGGFWKLPHASLNDDVSLTDQHKSDARPGYFAEVDPLILKKVEQQLKRGLTTAYKQMLGI